MHNAKQQLIAWSKYGVLWSETSKEKLGEFTESEIFNNQREVVAKLVGSSVLSLNNEIIGQLKVFQNGRFINNEPHSFELLINGKVVGLCNCGKGMSAAVLALLRKELTENT